MSELIFAEGRFLDAYSDLFTLVDRYPEDKRDQPGASGEWSPRQLLAHLSGWIGVAQKRYDQFEAGDKGSIYYHDKTDEMNAQAVAARAHLTWKQTVAELRLRVFELSSRASNVPSEKAKVDDRYQEWLDGLAKDCREHIEQLRQFLV